MRTSIAPSTSRQPAGVPSAWFWKPDDPYYHSVHDTADKIDGNSLKAVGDIAGAAAIHLADE